MARYSASTKYCPTRSCGKYCRTIFVSCLRAGAFAEIRLAVVRIEVVLPILVLHPRRRRNRIVHRPRVLYVDDRPHGGRQMRSPVRLCRVPLTALIDAQHAGCILVAAAVARFDSLAEMSVPACDEFGDFAASVSLRLTAAASMTGRSSAARAGEICTPTSAIVTALEV